MNARALLTDGNVVTLVAALETSRGLVFVDTLGHRYPPSKIISYTPRPLEVVK